MLGSGIPGIVEYQALDDDRDFRRLYDYSREFPSRAGEGSSHLRLYAAKWVRDPFLQWSRRWEYVYVLQRLESWWQNMPPSLEIADAGSGYTFFPFFLKELNPDVHIHCIDMDATAGRAIQDAAGNLGKGPDFMQDDLESLSRASESLDAVYSVSVIEHTRNPGRVIDEMHRVLKPGGLFVCTFDISFERASPMSVNRVESLLRRLHELFEDSDGPNPVITEYAARSDRVTTDWIAQECPDRLPWTYPRLTWLYDALRGRLRSGLYRPMTFYCGAWCRKSA